jgi:hypothetical protein
MSDWLERYRAGACAEVWAEMDGLGVDVQKPSHRKAAEQVACETMERCRKNVLWLFDGLQQLGYRFRDPAEPGPPDYPLELRIQGTLDYVRVKGGKKYATDPWSHPAFAWVDDEDIDLPAHHRKGRPGRSQFRPLGAKNAAAMKSIELPLSVHCWFEIVGCVDLGGTHPVLNRDGEVEALRVVWGPEWAGSGAGADFVASLRLAFHWAGLPGWSRRPEAPERELEWLRSKLIPV